MPFIPHTEEDINAMLDAIGVGSIETLFDEIPAELRAASLTRVPEGLSELDLGRLMQERAERDGRPLCFIGAGAYEHHIPAAVWEITTRGEFYSAYTPYQAEASQGTLQLIYEYQTMMTRLTGLDVSNASLYDGASALAEAVLMAVRSHKTSRRVLMPKTVHPIYRRVVDTTVKNQRIELVEVDYDPATGRTVLPDNPGDFAGLVIPQPNFFGVLEDVHAMTDWAHGKNALAIALVNPTTLAVLEAPGKWGMVSPSRCKRASNTSAAPKPRPTSAPTKAWSSPLPRNTWRCWGRRGWLKSRPRATRAPCCLPTNSPRYRMLRARLSAPSSTKSC